jgi:hypothetical protein
VVPLPTRSIRLSSLLQAHLLNDIQAAKAYEQHCAKNGQPASHAEAKEILAGFAGAFIDREFETRGVSITSPLVYHWY